MEDGKENENRLAFNQRAKRKRKPRPTLFGFACARARMRPPFLPQTQDRRPGFFEALVSWAAYALPSAPSLNAAAGQPSLHTLPHRWKEKNPAS